MVIQFQPILGLGTRKSHLLSQCGSQNVNLRGHSFMTRFLIGVMPKAMYRNSPETFDVFLTKAMQDFEKLYFQGLDVGCGTLRFVVLGLKGDLPFLSKAGHLTRTFMHIRKGPAGPKSKALTGCCWKCSAGSAAICFEDLSRNPDWIHTCGPNNTLPWDVIPPWFDHVPHVPSDKGSFFKLDVLHIYHLGIGRDFGASALTCLLGLFEGSIPDKLASMNLQLKRFLKATRKQVHFKLLTRDLLGYTSESVYPSGHWNKAFDTPVLLDFAHWLLQQHEDEMNASRELMIIGSACQAMSVFMNVLLVAGLWLTPGQASESGENGLHFLACYQKLVALCYHAGKCRFNLVPKLHCFHHLCLDLIQRAGRGCKAQNPLSECTFQDEDFIGRVSRLSRRVSPRLQCVRTIQRYLVATKYSLPGNGE